MLSLVTFVGEIDHSTENGQNQQDEKEVGVFWDDEFEQGRSQNNDKDHREQDGDLIVIRWSISHETDLFTIRWLIWDELCELCIVKVNVKC